MRISGLFFMLVVLSLSVAKAEKLSYQEMVDIQSAVCANPPNFQPLMDLDVGPMTSQPVPTPQSQPQPEPAPAPVVDYVICTSIGMKRASANQRTFGGNEMEALRAARAQVIRKCFRQQCFYGGTMTCETFDRQDLLLKRYQEVNGKFNEIN